MDETEEHDSSSPGSHSVYHGYGSGGSDSDCFSDGQEHLSNSGSDDPELPQIPTTISTRYLTAHITRSNIWIYLP
eukprot:scaffold49525_cov33-Attheya_sp.AAC.3